jgi:hypothetical protein
MDEKHCRLDSGFGDWVPPRSTRYGKRRLEAPVSLMEVDMTTPRTRALVSLAASFALTILLGACAGATPRAGLEQPAAAEATTPTIQFANDERDYVHVYLIGDKRQWLLGRVEQGAVATLRIPVEALAGEIGFMQLAVIAGERVTMQAARAPHAKLAIAQPATAVLSQRWRFAQGELTGVMPNSRHSTGLDSTDAHVPTRSAP